MFYDKFTWRSTVASIIDYAWQFAPYRASLAALADAPATAPTAVVLAVAAPTAAAAAAAVPRAPSISATPRLLSPFCNAVATDLAHFVEELVKALEAAHEIEKLQDDAGAWAALGAEVQRDKEAALKQVSRYRVSVVGTAVWSIATAMLYATPAKTPRLQSEGLARWALQHLTELVHLVGATASPPLGSAAAAWLVPETLERMLPALGYFFDSIVNPLKRRLLRIRRADALGFKPRETLLEVLMVYVNLSAASLAHAIIATGCPGQVGYYDRVAPGSFPGGAAADTFALAVVRDARSFHVSNFVGEYEQGGAAAMCRCGGALHASSETGHRMDYTAAAIRRPVHARA